MEEKIIKNLVKDCVPLDIYMQLFAIAKDRGLSLKKVEGLKPSVRESYETACKSIDKSLESITGNLADVIREFRKDIAKPVKYLYECSYNLDHAKENAEIVHNKYIAFLDNILNAVQ